MLSNGSPYATGPLSCDSCLSVCNVGVLLPNGWMDQYTTWYGVGLCQADIVLDGDPAPPTERGTTSLKGHSSPHFSTNFALARSPISATAELLFFFCRTELPFRALHVGWQWRNLSMPYLCQLFFPAIMWGQALRNVTYCGITVLVREW